MIIIFDHLLTEDKAKRDSSADDYNWFDYGDYDYDKNNNKNNNNNDDDENNKSDYDYDYNNKNQAIGTDFSYLDTL